jgi:hypothetical protein
VKFIIALVGRRVPKQEQSAFFGFGTSGNFVEIMKNIGNDFFVQNGVILINGLDDF